jgi:peptidyl-prolyl cis-trans isomerase C
MLHKRSLGLGIVLGCAGTLGSLGFIACQKSDKKHAAKAAEALPPQSSEELALPVAEIDGVVITLGDFQDRINKQSPYIRARYTSLERKKEFLDNLIRFEVLATEAKKRGLDQDPEVVRTMKQVMIQKLMKVEFDTRVKPEDVTEDEMKKFYDEHSSEYNKPEEVRVSAVILKDKATADKVAGLAKGQQGQDNKGFRDLVTQYSTDDETKQRGGDLRYFDQSTTEVPKEVVEASFKLEKTGDVAGPIAAGKVFYVIKQTGRRKALTKTYDEVKRQIQNRIYRDKRTKAMEDFVTGLRDKAKVVVHDDALAKVRVDTSGQGDTGEMDPHGIMGGGGGLPGEVPMMAPPGGAPAGGTPPAPAPTPAPGGKAPAPAPGVKATPPGPTAPKPEK